VLRDAPADQANVAISYRVPPDDADATDTIVSEAIRQALDPIGRTVVRVARSDTFALPDQPEGEVRNLAVLGYAEELTDQATIVEGAWPETGGGSGSAIPVALSESVAGGLGLAFGDRLALPSRTDAGFIPQVQVTAIFRIDDPTAAYWWAEPLAIEGVVTSGRFVTYGPFYTTKPDLLTRGTSGRVGFTWRAVPDVDAVTVGGVGDLASGVRALAPRLDTALGTGVNLPRRPSTGVPPRSPGAASGARRGRATRASVRSPCVRIRAPSPRGS
jgi:hypothetical protein